MLICGKTAKKLVFEEVDFPIEEESEIIKIMRLDVESHIKGYHIYKRLEPEKVVSRFAVAVGKEGQVVGHLSKKV